MKKLASASLSVAQLADLASAQAGRCEVQIRSELSDEELAVLDGLELEAQVRLITSACSPWHPTASVAFFKRRLARIANTRE